MINKFKARGTDYELERRFKKFVEITRRKSHYAVQGYSRSPILVPIESSYIYDSLLMINTNFPPILHRFQDGQIFASDRKVPHFKALAMGNPYQYRRK